MNKMTKQPKSLNLRKTALWCLSHIGEQTVPVGIADARLAPSRTRSGRIKEWLHRNLQMGINRIAFGDEPLGLRFLHHPGGTRWQCHHVPDAPTMPSSSSSTQSAAAALRICGGCVGRVRR